MLEFINVENLKPLKLVVNSGNGAAGPALDAIHKELIAIGVNIDFFKVHHTPNGNFPNGIPNPLLQDFRADTATAVIEHKTNMGIAWDGDFDRCFLFDENGDFIEWYYIEGLLAETFLHSSPGEKIIHDPRLSWNTIDIVKNADGMPIMNKTGHAFIKERMRSENAISGGEMSAYHYFRDFAYCDSGVIPWLLVAELLSVKNKSLSSLVKARIEAFPSSGEINLKLDNPKEAIEHVLSNYKVSAVDFDETDGILLAINDADGEWRFNSRTSHTEPVVH